MFVAPLLDVQDCLLSVWNIRQGLSSHPKLPLLVHRARVAPPKCEPCLNTMAETPSSVCWLLAHGLDLVVL